MKKDAEKSPTKSSRLKSFTILAALILASYAAMKLDVSFGVAMFLFGFLGIFGLLFIDAYSWLSDHQNSLAAKAATLILGVLIVPASLAYSRQLIADTTGINPSVFTNAIVFGQLLNFPYIIISGISILSQIAIFLAVLVSPVYLMWYTLGPGTPNVSPRTIEYWKGFIAPIVFAFVAGLALGTMTFFGKVLDTYYPSAQQSTIASFIYEFEMYSGTQCALAPNVKIMHVADKAILSATKANDGSIAFKRTICKTG